MPLPDTANVGDPGHVTDHNMLTAALTPLAGGTAGQVPTKASATDFDFTWAAPSGGSSLSPFLLMGA